MVQEAWSDDNFFYYAKKEKKNVKRVWVKSKIFRAEVIKVEYKKKKMKNVF